MEWYVGMNPADSQLQDDVLAAVHSVARDLPIDGLFLDFVRWPLHWEIELRPGRPRPLDSSFDTATLAHFEATCGALPGDLSSTRQKAAWLRDNRRSAWIDFKCQIITDFVARARDTLKSARPEAELGVYVVPDVDCQTEGLTGQRIRDLAPIVDRIAPMLYHNILLQPPAWVGPALARVAAAAPSKTLPVLQADSNRDPNDAADWGPAMSIDNFKAALDEVVAQADVAGLIVFPGAALLAGRDRALNEATRAWR